MNGIIYCRVSSKEQIEGTSLETQELACRDYARSKNIKILNIVVAIFPIVLSSGLSSPFNRVSIQPVTE